jgi:hypothetical protein
VDSPEQLNSLAPAVEPQETPGPSKDQPKAKSKPGHKRRAPAATKN